MITGCSNLSLYNKVAGATYICTSYEIECKSTEVSSKDKYDAEYDAELFIGKSMIFNSDGSVDGDFFVVYLIPEGIKWHVLYSNRVEVYGNCHFDFCGDGLSYTFPYNENINMIWYFEKTNSQ